MPSLYEEPITCGNLQNSVQFLRLSRKQLAGRESGAPKIRTKFQNFDDGRYHTRCLRLRGFAERRDMSRPLFFLQYREGISK